MGPPGASTTRWLAVFPFAEENGVRPTLSAGNFPPGAETLLEAPTIAKDFHGFISTTFRDYKYISVMAEAQCLLEGDGGAIGLQAYVLTIWREGFADFLPWLQMHRPMDLSVVIFPVSESGASESLQATGLWLGKQFDTRQWMTKKLSSIESEVQGTLTDLPASKGWGQKLDQVPKELSQLKDIAASQLQHFHAHVFVNPDQPTQTLPEWREFYQRIAAEFANERFVVEGGAVEGPIGPHPCSQFEIVFFRPATTEFIEWLQFNRPGELPILLHPMLYKSDADQLYGEYYDHGLRAYWLGPQLPNLGLEFLANIDIKVRAGVQRPYAMFDWQRPRDGTPVFAK